MTPDSPFSPVHSRQSFLETLGAGDALRRLDEGLGAREPFLLVTGEPGTGKTALAHEAVARWGDRVTAAFLAYPARTAAELLEELIRRFGAEPPDGASRPKLVACLERALAEKSGSGQVAVVVVDDAHSMPQELLEEIRLLVNVAQQARLPLEVMLVGLPALEARLDEPSLAALRQRVAVRVRLEPLSAAETRRYLHHRVTAAGGNGPSMFPRKTCRDIAAQTGGVPRRINTLAAEVLRLMQVWGDQSVGPEHVQTAAAALWGYVPAREVEDPADAEPADSPPQAAAPAPPAKPAAPAPAAVAPAPAGAPGPIAPPAPPPKAATPIAAPAPAAKAAAPPPAPPAKPAAPPSQAQTRPSAKAAAKAPAPAAAPAASGPPPEAAAPAPSAKRVVPAPPAEKPDETYTEESYTPPVVPATHDPQEWVKRFVGDRGPLQLSSRSTGEVDWLPDPIEPPLPAATAEPAAGEAPAPAEMAPPPKKKRRDRPGRGHGPSRSKRGGGQRMVIAGSLVAVVVIAVVSLVIRAGGLARKDAPAKGAEATKTAAAESVLKPSPREVPAASERKTAASAPARAESPRAESQTSRSRRPHTLEVGAYDDLDRAYDQRDRMQQLTGIEGWVVPAGNGSGKHRVVLGAYRSHDRATGAANMLLRSKTLTRVTVVPLPPKGDRY